MFEDPRLLTNSDWSNIHLWMQLLWYYFLIIIAFVVTMLTAHAFIPSLITTGHIPARANALRRPLTLLALAFLVIAIVLLALNIGAVQAIANFYDRWLI